MVQDLGSLGPRRSPGPLGHAIPWGPQGARGRCRVYPWGLDPVGTPLGESETGHLGEPQDPGWTPFINDIGKPTNPPRFQALDLRSPGLGGSIGRSWGPLGIPPGPGIGPCGPPGIIPGDPPGGFSNWPSWGALRPRVENVQAQESLESSSFGPRIPWAPRDPLGTPWPLALINYALKFVRSASRTCVCQLLLLGCSNVCFKDRGRSDVQIRRIML